MMTEDTSPAKALKKAFREGFMENKEMVCITVFRNRALARASTAEKERALKELLEEFKESGHIAAKGSVCFRNTVLEQICVDLRGVHHPCGPSSNQMLALPRILERFPLLRSLVPRGGQNFFL